jgi:hypothetical protein
MELCALASKEQDSAKLRALTKEIARLLEEKERRLKGQLPATDETSSQMSADWGISLFAPLSPFGLLSSRSNGIPAHAAFPQSPAFRPS